MERNSNLTIPILEFKNPEREKKAEEWWLNRCVSKKGNENNGKSE